ncbi:hypothetical protein QAD02_024234 [Eretmocerus hayati]|uniref:Uncharacterized protein n=1 Tax=Eretmocerus hayati TaxID=131215 RepID=A0ACC2PYU1_9HYME|nr:hypothetical protein QAD02_024234 [Eretmocerus hayati]
MVVWSARLYCDSQLRSDDELMIAILLSVGSSFATAGVWHTHHGSTRLNCCDKGPRVGNRVPSGFTFKSGSGKVRKLWRRRGSGGGLTIKEDKKGRIGILMAYVVVVLCQALSPMTL